MHRSPWVMTISMVVFIVAPALADEPAPRARAPWEYGVEERLEMRFDRAARAKRVGEHAVAWGYASGTKAEVVDGNVHPELFLPFELFDSVINKLESPQREAWWRGFNHLVRAAGFDETTFWRDVEALSASYLALRRQINEVAQRFRTAPESEYPELRRQGTLLMRQLCVARHAALNAVRQHFGETKFDRFLYEQMAPGLSTSLQAGADLDQYENELRARARGCQ